MDKSEMLKLLDSHTISALLKIYNLKYKHIAVRLHCTKQNIVSMMKTDRFTESQRRTVLDLFLQHGLEATELVLIYHMTNKLRKVNQK